MGTKTASASDITLMGKSPIWRQKAQILVKKTDSQHFYDIKYMIRDTQDQDLKLTKAKIERKATFSAQICKKMDTVDMATMSTKKEKEKMEARGIVDIVVEFRS